MSTTLDAIRTRVNSDVSLITSVNATEAVDWCNRCLRELGPLARKQTSATLSLLTSTKLYTAPTDMVGGPVYILDSDGEEYDSNPWSLRVVSGVLKVVFQATPSTAETVTLYYYQPFTAVSAVGDTLAIEDDLTDVITAYINWKKLEQQLETEMATRWGSEYMRLKDEYAFNRDERFPMGVESRRAKGWWGSDVR